MIFITGDTHGEMSMGKLSFKNWPIGRNLCEYDYVIIAGDFGLIFNNVQTKAEKHWIKWLNESPWTTLFVDGNHDGHIQLQELSKIKRFGGMVGKVSHKIWHLRRGEVYTIDDKKIFTFGGAASQDKLYRTEGISWWPEEVPNYKECQYALDNLEKHNNKVDYIITHTCPDTVARIFCHLTGRPKRPDPTGGYLDEFARIIDFEKWYYGHWHEDWTYGRYNMIYDKIVGIGENSFKIP